jgi:dTDP-4-dehydrorhamnose reductase
MSSSLDEPGVLVTGATGQLGTAIRSVLPQATFLTRRDLDLSDTASIPGVLSARRPSAVINCAAYTDVDLAESEEDLATTVNGDAVGVLAEWCAGHAIPFVTFSTDYVFDGRSVNPYVESDPVGPIGAYGRSKLRGEELALERYPGALVVRTSWVISATHDNFISTMLRLAQRGPLKVVDDQRGRPTIAGDLAVATVAALENGLHGIVHLANEGETTWYGLATAAIQLAGLDAALVDPCTTDEFPTVASRPAYSVLGTERADGPQLPAWTSSLPSLVAGQVQRIWASGFEQGPR